MQQELEEKTDGKGFKKECVVGGVEGDPRLHAPYCEQRCGNAEKRRNSLE